MSDRIVDQIVAKQRQDVEVLAERAADLHASQQAMPDDGALEEHRQIVRAAWAAGHEGALSFAVQLTERERIVRLSASSTRRLRTWLSQPNGSFRVGEWTSQTTRDVTFEAVEDGGILVRVAP